VMVEIDVCFVVPEDAGMIVRSSGMESVASILGKLQPGGSRIRNNSNQQSALKIRVFFLKLNADCSFTVDHINSGSSRSSVRNRKSFVFLRF